MKKRLLFVALACACGPAVAISDDASGTSTSDPSTTASTTIATSSPGTSATSGPGTSVGTTPEPTTIATTIDETTTEVGEDECGESCCAFLCPPDGGGETIECDVWAQDCPRGEKCMPWANDGGSAWNATRCSPLDPQPGQPGDLCLVEGSGVSGIDDCDVGLVCMYVDPETLAGTCVPNCMGSEANATCLDPAARCEIAFEGTIISCLHACDPLLQDCPEGAACYPGDLGFVCGDTLEPAIAIGEPCNYEWDCVAGSFCAAADTLPACAGDACCTPYCDTTVIDGCAPEEICTPIYDGSTAGYCIAP